MIPINFTISSADNSGSDIVKWTFGVKPIGPVEIGFDFSGTFKLKDLIDNEVIYINKFRKREEKLCLMVNKFNMKASGDCG